MSTEQSSIESRFARLRGRESRSESIATRFTPAEAKALLRRAEESGQNLREWAREVLLRELRGSASSPMGSTMLTEIVGLHLFLINVLSPIARGECISQEYFQEILRHVREHKHGATAEILGTAVSAPAEGQK